MNEFLIKTYVKSKCFVDKLIRSEEGMGMVELALIIIILIGLALIFKTEIEKFMTKIFKEFNIDALKG
jgi:Flp pilus assembly pilin Flp